MYLFIANKPDSSDYCRGCHMASYSSDFVLEKGLSREKLVTIWAEYRLKNLNLDCNESGYEFYIFEKEIQLWSEFGYCAYDDNGDDLDFTEIVKINMEAVALASKLHNDMLAKQKAARDAKAEQQRIQNLEYKKRTYQALKKEFENG